MQNKNNYSDSSKILHSTLHFSESIHRLRIYIQKLYENFI